MLILSFGKMFMKKNVRSSNISLLFYKLILKCLVYYFEIIWMGDCNISILVRNLWMQWISINWNSVRIFRAFENMRDMRYMRYMRDICDKLYEEHIFVFYWYTLYID